jgi:hypothetical protein
MTLTASTENTALPVPPEALPPPRPFWLPFAGASVVVAVALTACVPAATPLGTVKVALNEPLPFVFT